MFKKDIKFNYITNRAIVIFLHGYKGNKNELSFLRDFIVKNKKFSFLSLSYKLKKGKKKNCTAKEIILNIKKNINIVSNDYHFDKYYLIGYSLGAALAVDIVSKKMIKCDGLALISIFDDRKNLLKYRGIKINNSENINPINSIKKIRKIPIIFIHGTLDKSVNLKRGKKVFNNSNKKNSEFITLPVDHYFKSVNSKKMLVKSVDNLFMR